MGTWSLLVVLLISCVASLEKKCPSNILNKFLSNPSMAKEHYDNGETISVTCLADSGDDGYDYFNYDGNDGLDAKNIRVLNCTDGKWIGHYPKCFSNCSKPDIYAILNPEYEVYAPGDNVIITACKKDNARIEGNTTLICMADGTWIGSAKCPKQHNSCNKQPPTISNAYITDAVLDEYKHGTVLRYKCSQAFDQMVKHSVTCNDGHWIPDSANLTICIIGHCSHIDSREIGYMHVKKISGQVGTYAEFECHDGYELDGSANILCMADRKWYPEIPKCKPISCPPPKQILNGRLLQEAYNGLLNIYQSTIRYDCDMGYRIVGPRFRKCQSDRTWSGNNTKCEEIVCEIPSPPENGTVYFTDDSQKVGSQIEYICDEHHIMEPKASKFAICTVHGHWSSPQPRCIKRCFIEPPINLEYFIGQEKVLENYIHSGTEMNARCSNRTELFRFSSYLEREQVSVKCNFGKLEPESLVCKDKRCNIITAVDNGHFRNSWKVFVTGEKIQSGTYIQLKCSEGYELHIKTNSMYLKLVQTDIKCYQGSFTTEIPSCEPKRCFIEPTTNLEYFIRQEKVLENYIHSGIVMNARCSNRTELFVSSSYLEREQVSVKCNLGKLEPESPVCKDKRCNIIATINNGHFINSGKVVVKGEKILSGSNIKLICFEGYELYNKTNSMYLDLEQTDIQCYQGSFTSETSSCEPKRCFIEPTTNLEYFIRQEKVLENYIHSGIVMNARCSNRTELFVSSSYLEREQVSVKCNLGKLEPESPVCKDKRCNIIATINNGHFINSGKVVVKGEKILSGSNIKLICFEGYELYNKMNSMYLDLEQTDIQCYQGSFTSETSLCEPKRCFIEPTTNLEYFIRQEKVLENYIHSGIVMNARCSNRTELFVSSSYLEREQVSVKCNLGKLEPESPVCKDKRCNIIATINNGHFINSGKVVVKGEKILSGSNIKLICFEGYELYNKMNSMYLDLEQTDIQCYQGSFTSETSLCEPKRCFIEPTTNLEYFIRQEKVLENYIHSGIVMNARCSNRTELFVSSSYLEREQVSVKCNLGKLEPESPVCKDKRCNIIATINNGHFINSGKVVVKGEKILSGSNIKLICFEGYELYNKMNSMYLDLEQTDIQCYQGSFTSETSLCEPKRCFIEPTTNLEYFIRQEKVLENYIHSGIVMNARCSNRTELFVSSSYLEREQVSVKCNLSKLEPESPVCKDKRCNIIATINNGHFINSGKVVVKGEKILSGSNIKLICFEGYELYNKTNSTYLDLEQTDIKCYQGSFTSETSTCVPKRCLIEPPVNMEYFIEGKKVLHKYIDNGTIMQPRCPDRMGLVLSSSYLDNEQTFVQCILGTLEPRTLECKGKMCKTIDLTREISGFIVSETKTKPGEFVPHNQSIQIVCGEGYRPHGILTCNAGIWMGNSTCELGCVLKDPGMHFISLGNRTVLNVGENANVSCKFGYQIVSNTSATPADQYDYDASEVSDGNYTCRDSGKWEPEIRFSCKQMCQTIDVAREITGFIVSETKTTPGEFVPHNQSIETVCGEGYRRHGVLTCNAGIWMGNSTCEPDVTRCVLKERGMHFISLGNRTELQVGENAKVSCKFGYQIVPIISAKGSYEYNYPDSESTADPSEMQETEDNENLITVSDRNYTCIDNGKWKPEIRFSCTQIMCDSFDKNNLENGNIIYSTHDGYSVGTVVSFQCNPGYTRHGPENRTCQIDGTWSGQCVTCQRDGSNASITCPAPCVPVGARKTGSFTYEIGSKVEISCTRSKTQDGGDRRIIKHCIKNGEYASWNGTMINCKEIICAKGDHYGFENGKVTYSSSVTTVFTEASFTCNPGYNLHGPMIRICQKNGTWSGECVTCQKHQPNSSTCPAPCIPDGAIRNGSLSDEIGSRIQLYCFESNMNYSVENSYIRHCVNDGKSASWNGTNINCKAKCKPLTDTYKVVKTGVVPGILSDKTVVELICNGSLEEVRAECRNGHWHPKKPTCKSKCEPLSDTYKVVKTGVLPRILSDKTVVELNCTGSLAKVQAECRNGQWHPKKPTCKLADTCSLSAVEGTLYNYKETKEKVFQGPIKSDRQIKVTCKDGFLPNTQNYDVSRCVNGVWKPEIVKCEKTDNF